MGLKIKKLIIILILVFPVMILGQKERNKFVEGNAGIASVDDYSFSWPIPGCSILYGETYSNDGLVTEWQLGLAFPTVATAKLFVGGGNLENNIGIGIRPWPFFVGPQAKIGRVSFSFEVGTNDTPSFEAGLIATMGYRWTIK
jgi:hypothetical protein